MINLGGYYGPLLSEILNQKITNPLIKVPTIAGRMKLLQRHRVDYVIEDELSGLFYIKEHQMSNIKLHQVILHLNEVSFLFSRKTVPVKLVEKFNNILSAEKDSLNQIIKSSNPILKNDFNRHKLLLNESLAGTTSSDFSYHLNSCYFS